MKALIKLVFILCIIIFLVNSCKKNTHEWDIYLVPHSLFFLAKQNNNRLPDSVLNNVKLSYFKNGNKLYVDDFGRATEEGRDLGILVTRNIAFPSSNDNIKTYYLEYPNGSKDTMFVDYGYYSSNNDAWNDPCKCSYPRRSVKFNGIEAQLDSTLLQIQDVYLFNKK